MPRRPRASTAGLTFHVVNRAAKKSLLFETFGDYAAFEDLLAAAAARFDDVAIYAYCVMPNHWHLLVLAKADGALSRFMHWLTTTHARRWQTARALDGQGAVYQGRFRAIPIETERQFLWVCRYVERNALRASLVDCAEQWRWSSMGHRCRAGDAAWLATWPVAPPADWIAQVNAPQTAGELRAFREAMKKRQPFGDEEWRDAVLRRLGTYPARRRGRPRRQPQPTVL